MLLLLCPLISVILNLNDRAFIFCYSLRMLFFLKPNRADTVFKFPCPFFPLPFRGGDGFIKLIFDL